MGNGGRHRMVLGATSLEPARRRSLFDGRSQLTKARAESGSICDDRAALFRDSTALPHGGRV